MKLLIKDPQHNPLQHFNSLFFLFLLLFSLSFTLFSDFLLTANTKQSIMGADKN
jgi:hypothetical protein